MYKRRLETSMCSQHCLPCTSLLGGDVSQSGFTFDYAASIRLCPHVSCLIMPFVDVNAGKVTLCGFNAGKVTEQPKQTRLLLVPKPPKS